MANEREGDLDDFRELRQTGDRTLRDQLVVRNRPLALQLARQFANRGEPLDDLNQVAMLGLFKAVERFDPDRGFAFAAFAAPTINGELKRHFRDRTWSVRVPRRVQELRLEMAGAVERLSHTLGRPPTVPEIASELGQSQDAILEAMEASAGYRAMSLSAPAGDERGGIEARIPVDDGTEATELRLLLEEHLGSLPEREQTIIRLRFIEEQTQSEIAEQVGICQMHVSRLLRRTLLELRDRMVSAGVATGGSGATGEWSDAPGDDFDED